MRQRQWVHAGTSPDRRSFAFEKAAIAAACQTLIGGVRGAASAAAINPVMTRVLADLRENLGPLDSGASRSSIGGELPIQILIVGYCYLRHRPPSRS